LAPISIDDAADWRWTHWPAAPTHVRPWDNAAMQVLTILGSTGSIGLSTLDVIARHPEHFRVAALSAFRKLDVLADQIARFQPPLVAVPDGAAADRLVAILADRGLSPPTILHAPLHPDGPTGFEVIAALPEVTTVMAAIVGAAGLAPTLAAARAGKRILLANKEALVMSGALLMDAVRAHGAELLPIDSEHNAIFQSLPRTFRIGEATALREAGVAKIILTASGGPFRTTPRERLRHVTPEQAVAHPNWVMGQKISVDSATMMNKGLEVIEARWLFAASPEQLEVVIHPQSVIHSMVSYLDGSVLAQLGQPDMRTPIAHALAYPQRIESGVAPLDFTTLGSLEFAACDFARFPCVRLAYEAMAQGGHAPAILNAANEMTVAAFLDRRLPFLAISDVNSRVLEAVDSTGSESLDGVYAADLTARALASQLIARVAATA
jgi:1-deoxy-D-xylulose-5-phosphate reductoisomerase